MDGRSNGGRHHTQPRDREGQFQGEGERLEYPIGCKISSSELRMYAILFDQHRKQFGWQTHSDMYRTLLRESIHSVKLRIKNPTRDMITLMEQADERDRIVSESSRHRQLEDIFQGLDESIGVLTRAGDLGGVRDLLGEFQLRTTRITDKAIKYRREMEFDTRWGRLWKELNRGARLPIDETD